MTLLRNSWEDFSFSLSLSQQRPYVKFNFRLYPTREEAEKALALSMASSEAMRRESELLLGHGAKLDSSVVQETTKSDRRFWAD